MQIGDDNWLGGEIQTDGEDGAGDTLTSTFGAFESDGESVFWTASTRHCPEYSVYWNTFPTPIFDTF